MLNLANYFKNAEDLEIFLNNIEEIKFDLKNEYEFLALNDATWDKLIDKSLVKNQKKLDIYLIKRTVKKFLINYINKKINNNETWIMSNLLIMLSKDCHESIVILKKFFQKLTEFKINLSDEYFESLKSTKIFQKILNSLGIINYSKKDVQDFLNNKKTKYPRKTLSDRIKRNKNLSSEEHVQIIMWLFYNKKPLEQKCINDYLEGKFTSYDKRYKTAINAIDVIKRQYIRYCTEVLGLEESFYNKNQKQNYLEFIIEVIYSEFNIRIANISEKKQKEYMLDLRKIEYVHCNKISKDEYLKFLKNKIIYLFQNGNVTLEQILDALIASEQENIAEEQKISEDLAKKRTFIPLVERIKKLEGITDEEHLTIISALFNELDIETRLIMADYLLGKFTSNDKRYSKVRIGMSTIRNKYQKYGKEALNVTRKPISERIPKASNLADIEHVKLVRVLFTSLPKQTQDLIISYINKDFGSSDPRFRIVKTSFDKLVTKYERETLDNKYLEQFIRVVREFINVSDNLSFEKSSLYDNALRLIFYYYTNNIGITKEEYLTDLKNKIASIIKEENIKLENILASYIKEEQEIINNQNFQR